MQYLFGTAAITCCCIIANASSFTENCNQDDLSNKSASNQWKQAQKAGVAVPGHIGPRYFQSGLLQTMSVAKRPEQVPDRVSGCDGSWNLAIESMPFSSDCICYDRRRRVTVIANPSDTWEWDGTSWTQVDSGASRGGTGAFVYDPVGQRCLYFGGYFNNQLWSWDGEEWLLLSDSPVPQRVYPAMAFDAHRNRLVVHGGYDSGSILYEDTWEWDPETGVWTETPSSPIGPLYAHRMVFDESRGQCVLHGGYYFTNQGDSWAWNGSAWSEITSTGPARYVFAMAYDRRSQQILLSGGTQCCGEVELPETWRMDGGNTWQLCDASAPARGYTNMAYDSFRHRMIFTGGWGPIGGGERGVLPQTWERELGPITLCHSDIDGDLVIDVNDIIEVLNAWQAVDPVADIDGSGIVDTNDILAIIRDWGPCP
ncbi:MAG: hypothetical protein MK077_10645 [Phycisphaerales bacterium]|nr:hypothetical protein [Phycisphaerales bacterium]